eukprot:6473379-Heterocapsa_arctica.AAC.1
MGQVHEKRKGVPGKGKEQDKPERKSWDPRGRGKPNKAERNQSGFLKTNPKPKASREMGHPKR